MSSIRLVTLAHLAALAAALPAQLLAAPFAYVPNEGSGTISVIDTATDKVVETIDCKPEAKLPFGTGSNAVALSDDAKTPFVAPVAYDRA